MKRSIAAVAATLAAVVFTTSAADAHWRKKTDKRVQKVEIGMGIASGVTYGSIIGWSWTKHSNAFNWGAAGYVTAGCIVISPIVATAILKRPVTEREFASMTGSCIVPIVGGWLAEQLYDSTHPVAMSAKRKKKKM